MWPLWLVTNPHRSTVPSSKTLIPHSCDLSLPCRYLTAATSDRKVLHLELNISGAGLSYSPGDAIGVLPQNPPELVEGLLQRLGLDGSMVFEVEAVGAC